MIESQESILRVVKKIIEDLYKIEGIQEDLDILLRETLWESAGQVCIKMDGELIYRFLLLGSNFCY